MAGEATELKLTANEIFQWTLTMERICTFGDWTENKWEPISV